MPAPLAWNRLLSDYRPGQPGRPARPAPQEPFRSAFETDYDRILYAAPLRRLARKTQVHPMAPNDQVHNRLTHSLEVASVGRSLARRLAGFLQQRGQMPEHRSAEDLAWILQSACLAHDLGNPPFGHAGEYAIRGWIAKHSIELFENAPHGEAIGDGTRQDWLIFEGNAQSFRLATRADNPQAAYLRLSFATLGAMIKYPWTSEDPRARAKGKHNVFSTEKAIFEELTDHMGLTRADGSVARHPLSFLSEAADDICYRILDLEDAVEMRILSEDRVRPVLGALSSATEPLTAMPLAMLRGRAIGALIGAAWQVFEDDYDTILHGDREADLKAGFPEPVREAIRDVAALYQEIFAHRAKIAAELGAYKALGRIIHALGLATGGLAKTRQYGGIHFIAQRCFDLTWGERYARENEAQPYDWWLHQILDYVSGLTDNHAQQLSREIAGV